MTGGFFVENKTLGNYINNKIKIFDMIKNSLISKCAYIGYKYTENCLFYNHFIMNIILLLLVV